MQRVRAVIIKQKCILLIKRTKKDCVYWVFPGGGVERHETCKSALAREVKEELGLDVKVGKLLAKNQSQKPETIGQDEFFYETKIVGGILGNASGPEYQLGSGYEGKYEITWVPIKKIQEINLLPIDVRTLIYKIYNDQQNPKNIK